jgi:hypothetical protein
MYLCFIDTSECEMADTGETVYVKGGQLDQLQEPHCRKLQSVTAMSHSCAQRLTSSFGITYSCECLYSTLTLIK